MTAGISASEIGTFTLEQAAIGLDGTSLFTVSTLQLTGPGCVGIIGPNGAGKSTLLSTLAGLTPPMAGSIRLDGKDLHTLSLRERSRTIAWLPQRDEVMQNFTGEEIVLMGRFPWHQGAPSQSDYRTVHAVMTDLGCENLRHIPIDRMSGGERQRVLLARAAAGDHRVMLLDEPEAHIDLATLTSLRQWLARAGRDRLVILAMHDLNMASRWCGQLVLLGRGGMVASGSPEEVMRPDRLEQAFGAPAQVLPVPGRGLLVSFD